MNHNGEDSYSIKFRNYYFLLLNHILSICGGVCKLHPMKTNELMDQLIHLIYNHSNHNYQ